MTLEKFAEFQRMEINKTKEVVEACEQGIMHLASELAEYNRTTKETQLLNATRNALETESMRGEKHLSMLIEANYALAVRIERKQTGYRVQEWQERTCF